MKNLNAYLTFSGNCGPAISFYNECLGGELKVMTFADAQMDVPAEAKNNILHASLIVDGFSIMASDALPGQSIVFGNSITLSIDCNSVEEQDRYFNNLSNGGKITMPLEDTFWNARFGMVTDKFGIQWMFNFEKQA